MSDTAQDKPRRVSCPNCKKQFDWNSPTNSRPFCSERCRLIDLGDWLEERRRIPDDRSPQPFLPPEEGQD
jgi:hypothetical protein